MENTDWIINGPTFLAKDGSYHEDIEGVRAANEIYWDSIMILKENPNLDLPLTESQMKKIINGQNYSSLVEVLDEFVLSQVSNEKSARKVRK